MTQLYWGDTDVDDVSVVSVGDVVVWVGVVVVGGGIVGVWVGFLETPSWPPSGILVVFSFSYRILEVSLCTEQCI